MFIYPHKKYGHIFLFHHYYYTLVSAALEINIYVILVQTEDTMANKVKIIEGGLEVDDRGNLKFANDFNFKNVKRFYQVKNYSTKTIRAFHGHKKEEKYAYVTSGSILLCVVKLTNYKKPSKKVTVERIVLSESKPQIVYIPSGYANGFKTLEKDSSIVFFSTSSLKKSKKDDYRYPYDYWGKDIWKVKNR